MFPLQPGALHHAGARRINPKRHSALSLRELERYIALDIVGSYHQSIHNSLSRPPNAVWREHEGEIPLRLAQDRMRFWLKFLPEQERTLRPICLVCATGHLRLAPTPVARTVVC